MGVSTRPLSLLASALDRTIGWDRLPRLLGLLTLLGIRHRLREKNLYDTGLVNPAPARPPDVDVRTVDGSYNDLAEPAMGSIGARFGRNVPIYRTFPEREPDVLEPNPRVVSTALLTRERFIPATTVNVLAAAWIQFEVHDWLSHETDKEAEPFELELAPDDPWPERPMKIERTQRDRASDDGLAPPAFSTYDSHWWDGSQIYGNDAELASALRGTGGKLRLDEHNLPPSDLDKYLDPAGIRGNFWIGLGLLHTLFTREHNAIVDELRAKERRTWTDDELYNTARLINAALMAKIHTVEWTPAIIAHPTTEWGMRANWYGLVGERVTKRFGRLGRSEAISGIPGSPTDHHRVPYSLTEEFVAVYRMHPLIPDEYVFRSVRDDRELATYTFRDLGALETRARLHELGVANSFYSFGLAHPGAIKLHNYPRFLQEFKRGPEEPVLDLAAIDILRIRERGVPRYNEFRKLFHRRPVASFQDLTRDRANAAELARLYGDVDRLDLMIGLYAEPLPQGFAISDTAFRVFILMASRRLKSDRFFTTDYTPAVYTQAGLDWINDTTMKKVLLRHYPELAPALRGVDNAFKPWVPVKP
jgi:Animal haem peroxidase